MWRKTQWYGAAGDGRSDSRPLGTLAAHVALSPSRFKHLFKAEVGNSVMRSITEARLVEGARLLATTEQDVASIAGAVGFTRPGYFSRCFGMQFGVSPRQYRERHQIGPG